jgi:hypothetical protein
MAANLIDNRLAAENASFDRVANQDRSKQNKDLLHLATVLRELEHEVAGAKDGGLGAAEKKGEKGPKVVNLDAQQSQGAQGSKNRFEDAMTELALMLQMLQVDIVKFQRNKTNDETQMSTAMVSLYKSIAKDIQNKIEKQEKAEKSQKALSFWTKIAEAVVTALVVGIALAFGQVEIAAMAIVMYAASASGLMSKAESGLAKGIEAGLKACGAHGKDLKLISNIIATVVILVVIAALTFMIAPEDIAGEAVNGAENIGEEAADEGSNAVEMTDVTEDTSTTTEESTEKVSRIRQILRKLRLPTKANMMIMALSQSISQMNIPQTVLDGMEINHKLSDEQKQKIEMIVTLVVAIMALLASVGSGDALADTMSEGGVKGGTSAAAKALGKVFGDISETAVGQMLNRVSKILEELSGMKAIVWMERFRRVVATGEAGLQIAEGSVLLEQADLDQLLGEDQAGMDLAQMAVNTNSSEQSDTQKQLASTLKQQRMSDQNLDLFAGEKALARVLTTQSPV